MKLTPSQAAELDAGADKRGVSWSDLPASWYSGALPRPARLPAPGKIPQAAALLRELNALGINLNQLMRHGNTTGELGAQRLSEIDDVLLDIKRAANRVYSL